jgi:hypothetical protein
MVDAIRGPASVLIDRVAKGSSNESCGERSRNMERSLKLGQTGTQCISDCEDGYQKIAKGHTKRRMR